MRTSTPGRAPNSPATAGKSRLKKTLASAVAALAVLSGLTALSVVTAEQAVAYPKAGTHVVEFGCEVPDGPDANSLPEPTTLLLNYTITDLGFHETLTTTREFEWQLNLARYTGPIGVTNSYLDGRIEYRGEGTPTSTSWLPAAGGTTGNHVFPRGSQTATVVTRVNGLDGVSFTPKPMQMRSTGEWANNRLWVTMNYGPDNFWNCSHVMDLGFPTNMNTGFQTGGWEWCEGETPPSATFDYDVQHVGGSTYTIKLKRVHAPPLLPGINLTFTLEDSEGDFYSLGPDGGPPLTGGVGQGGTTYVDANPPGTSGPTVVNFPTRSFQWYGGTSTMPTITVSDTSGICESDWELGSTWNVINYQETADSYEFVDCSNGSPGFVTFRIVWAIDSNKNITYPRTLTMVNSSGAVLKMVDGPAMPKALTYGSGLGLSPISYLDATALAADRVWNPGVARNADISYPPKWTVTDPTYQVGAPNKVYMPRADQPAFVVNLQAFHPTTGAACPTGDDLQSMALTRA